MGTTLKISPDRYDDPHAVESFSADEALVEDEFAVVDLTLGKDHEIYISLAAPTGSPAVGVVELARLVLSNLAAFDLIVQKNCADECERTKFDSDNFESCLGGISISLDTIKLHYWGDVVNTEWDEVFSLLDGKWRHAASGTGPGTGVEVILGHREHLHDA
jgi:hypothetical protein